MESYKVYWKKSAEKDLLKIDQKIIPIIINNIETLISNPFPKNTCKIHGTDKIYRIKISSYRLIYLVDTEKKIIIIYYIRHRKDAYRKYN